MQDPLASAVQLHQSGRLKEAAAAYQQCLRRDPDNSEALHLYGVLAHQAGDAKAALRHLRRAIALDDTRPVYHFNLGVVLADVGDDAAAEEAYRRCLVCDPAHGDAHNNLGLLLERRGDAQGAAACFRRAIESAADHAPAHANLGRALQETGETAEALAAFERAVALAPDLAEAHFGRGRCFEDQLRWDDAEAAYRAALRCRPDFQEALNNLAAVLLAKGNTGPARAAFDRLREVRRGPVLADPDAVLNAGPAPARGAPRPLATRFLLLDRAQQLEHLVAAGRVDPGFLDVAKRLRAVLKEFGPVHGPDWRRALGAKQAASLGGALERIVHLAEAPALTGPAVNPQLDFAALEEAYLAAEVPAVWFDALLTPEALAGLRRFCQDSTIYFGSDPAGFVSSYMRDGFNCALMYQIAAELKARLPRVLGAHHVANMWSYRHVAEGGGVLPHTDLAAVTFNFWIGPEAGNLDPAGGGLVVYAKGQPADWDWMRINREKSRPEVRAQIEGFLEGAAEIVIPHRENRAVMFHSNLFHKSDRLSFKDDFESRRINISLLFGRYSGSAARLPA